MTTPLSIEQFRYSSDNLAYLIYGEHAAVAIDGGAVEEILQFTAAHKLTLKYIAYTHTHPDHTVGMQTLKNRSGATGLSCEALIETPSIELEAQPIYIYHTPGHTQDSLVFHAGNFLVTGDTLFNGTVGNCFSGDLRAFYRSITHLLTLPDDTFIYAGHDYITDSMQFAKLLEPNNRAITTYLEQYDPDHVVSTLADEKKVNPYLRFNTPEIISLLKRRGLPTGSAYERWESLMSIE